MQDSYMARIEAMARHIKKLENKIKLLKSKNAL